MQSISRLTDTALASAVYASREALPLPCKTCFRLAGCAFSGRVSNPLDHDRRFLVTFPSSFSGLCLTLAQFDCKNTAYGIIMGSSGWQVVHCPGFHQYLLCTGGDLTPWVGSSFPPATPCIGSGKRRLCTAHTRSGHWRTSLRLWLLPKIRQQRDQSCGPDSFGSCSARKTLL